MEKVTTETIKKPGLIKRMIMTGQLKRLIIYLVTVILAIIFTILGLFAILEILNPISIDGLQIGTPVDYFIFAILFASGVFGIYEFLRYRRIQKIDGRFPDFVRDLAESRRAGMTFTKAILYSAKGNYGVLTSEIQTIARQISWGSSVEDALNDFAKRVNTRLIKRTISLIIEASRSGGNVADVLNAASKDAREMKLIESERKASMLSYVAVIYVGMGVFLMIVIILCKTLLPAMIGGESTGFAIDIGNVGQVAADGISQQDVTIFFLYASLIQSAGMGLVTGVFEQGRYVAGIKHIFIMILLTWIVFKFIVAI